MDQSEDELGLVLSEEELEENSADTVDIYGDLSIGSNSERREEEEQHLQTEKEKASSHQGKGNDAQFEIDSPRKDISLENNLYDSILLSTDLEKYRKVIVDLQSQVDTLKMQLEKTQKQCQDYEADNKVLLMNMSSLWKVAKADFRKSEEAYKKLCKEQDALIFRRAMHQIPRGEVIRIVTQLGNFSRDDFNQFMEMLRGSKTDTCMCQSGWKANVKGNESGSPIAHRVNGRRIHPAQFSPSGKPWLFTSTPKMEIGNLHHHGQEKTLEEEEVNAIPDKLTNINRNDSKVRVKEKSKMERKTRKFSGKRNNNVIDSGDDREEGYSWSSRVLRSRVDNKKARQGSRECNEGMSKRQSLDYPSNHQYHSKRKRNEEDSSYSQETSKGRGRKSKRKNSLGEYGNEEEMVDRSESSTPKISDNCEEKGTVDKAHSLPSEEHVEVCNHSNVGPQPSRISRRLFRQEGSQKENSQEDVTLAVDNRCQEKGDLGHAKRQKTEVYYLRGVAGEKSQKENSHQESTLPCEKTQIGDSFSTRDKDSVNSEWIDNKTQSVSQKSNDVDNLQGNNNCLGDTTCEIKEKVGDIVNKNNAEASVGSSAVTAEVISDSIDQIKDNQCYRKDVQKVDAPKDEEKESNCSNDSKNKRASSELEDRNMSKNQIGYKQKSCNGSMMPVLGDSGEASLVMTRSEDEVKAVSESGEESLEEGEISDDSEEEEKKKRCEQSGSAAEMSRKHCDVEPRKDTRKKTWESNWRKPERREKVRKDQGHQNRGARSEGKSHSYSGDRESKNSPSPHKSRRTLGKYREMERSLHRSREDSNTLVSRQHRTGRRVLSREKNDRRDYRCKDFLCQADLERGRKSRESVRDRARRDTVESRDRSPKKRKTPNRDSTRENRLGITKEKSKKSKKDERKAQTGSVSRRPGLRSAEKIKSVEDSDDCIGRKLPEKEKIEKSPGLEKKKCHIEDTGDDTIDFLVSEHHKKYPLEVLMNGEDSESSLLQYIDTASEMKKDSKGETSIHASQMETEAASSDLENSGDLDCLEETLVDIDIGHADTDISFCDRRKGESSAEGTEPAELGSQEGSSNLGASGLDSEAREKDVGDTSVSESKDGKSSSNTEQLDIEIESQTTLPTEIIHETSEGFTDSLSNSVCSSEVHQVRNGNKLHTVCQDVDQKSDRVEVNDDTRPLKWWKSVNPVNSTISAGRNVDSSESLQVRDDEKKKLTGSDSGHGKLVDSCEELDTQTSVQCFENSSSQNSCPNRQVRSENQSFQDRSESELCDSYSNSDSSSSSSSDSDSDSSCSDTDCNCSDSSSCDSSPDKKSTSSSSPVFDQHTETSTHLPLYQNPVGRKLFNDTATTNESQCKVLSPQYSQEGNALKTDSPGTHVEDQTSCKRQLEEGDVSVRDQLAKSQEIGCSKDTCNESHWSTSNRLSQEQMSSDFRGIMDAKQPVVVRRKVRRSLNLNCSNSCSNGSSISRRLSPFNANSIISIVYTRDSSLHTTDSVSFSSPSVCTKSTFSCTSMAAQNGNSPSGATGSMSAEQTLVDRSNSPPREKQEIRSSQGTSGVLSTPEEDSPKPKRQNSRNKQTIISTRTSPRRNLSPSPRRSPRKNYSQ